jgi:hypothetical protein
MMLGMMIILLVGIVTSAIIIYNFNPKTSMTPWEEKIVDKGEFNISVYVSKIVEKNEQEFAEEEVKRERDREYQKKYRVKKKMEKQIHELMVKVQEQNKAYNNKFDRYDILDFEE